MKMQAWVHTSLFAAALGAAFLHAAPARADGSFTLVQPMKQFRKLHTATRLANGKVLVAGGRPFPQTGVSELYDPDTETWITSGALNDARIFHTATLLKDGKEMVTGGQTANRLLGATEVYDPNTGEWKAEGELNVPRELHTATLLTGGFVLVAGGFQNIDSAEVFDPAQGEWKFTGSMNVPRY